MRKPGSSAAFYAFNLWIFRAFIVLSIGKIAAIPLDQLRGLGDITHFYNLAQIPGLPFVNYWVEFPPIPVYVFEGFYWLAGEDLQTFTYLFLIFITVVNFGNLYFFSKILNTIEKFSAAAKKNLLFFYMLAMLFLPYTWWYFDGLTLLFLLIGFVYFLNKQELLSIGFISLGILTKLFPALFLVVFLKRKMTWRLILKLFVIVVVFVGLPYFFLLQLSHEMTMASLVSQAMKGSWETIWALMDGNYQTGNFGPLWERLDPALAYRRIGNAPVIDTKITLFLFGLIGFMGIWRKKVNTSQQFAQLILFTMCVFFLWSAGWSPQWVLYIFPFLLLAFPNPRVGIYLSILLIFINLLEWPVIIGLQLLNLLPITIIIRTVIFVALAGYSYQIMGRD